MGTRVEWCDETLNPWAGCDKISEGCKNCAALSFARRLAGQNHPKYEGVVKDGEWSGMVNFQASELDKLCHWRKPRRVFIQIMGDVAHNNVDIIEFSMVMSMIRTNHRHTCMMLTKRPRRLKEMLDAYYASSLIARSKTPLQNLWLGVTAENQEQADKRIPVLLKTPAAKRFVSIEPMLGPVNLELAQCTCAWPEDAIQTRHNLQCPADIRRTADADIPAVTRRWLLDQVIVGAETGPGKREMHPTWAYAIACECRRAEVPFFGKKDSDGNPLKIDGHVIRELAE